MSRNIVIVLVSKRNVHRSSVNKLKTAIPYYIDVIVPAETGLNVTCICPC